MEIEIIGIYPVDAEEPCNLVELKVINHIPGLDIGDITQEVPGEAPANWQVPYDEHFLSLDGISVLNPESPDDLPEENDFRVVFFFHYLDFNRPLKTPAGEIKLPSPTKRPGRLIFIEYEQP